MVNELPNLEKALSKADFVAQKASLEQILKAIRPLRLKSLEDLDLAARGKLLTSIVRVQRQAKPEGFDAFVQQQGAAVTSPPEPTEPPAITTPPEGVSSPEAAPSEVTTEPAGAEAPAEPTPAEAAPDTAAEGVASGTPDLDKPKAYQDVLFLVGRIWRAAGEADRAQAAFELSGRPAPSGEEPAPAEERREAREGREGARGERPGKGRGEKRERGERPARGERPERGERGERREGGERPAREARPQREPVNIPVGGNWQEVAKEYETAGRTRDAARVHERNSSWVDAARLFEAGGNPREALRCALAAKDNDLARRIVSALPVDQARSVLEKANAWELLMERYIAAQDFENVAKLYERARQFDQAGLAWEKAGKLAASRKAYERARDFKSVQRVRNLEVDKLIERGDRLGAAQMLVQARRKEEAVAVLLNLPAPKAYRFMERLGLNDAGKALAQRELEKATAENKPGARARWLEMLDDNGAAAQAWVESGRLERASVCNEKAGNLKAAAEQAEAVGELDRAQDLYRRAGDTESQNRVAAMPRPSPEERKKKQKLSAEEEAADAEHAAAESEAATAHAAAAQATRAEGEAGAPEFSGPPADQPADQDSGTGQEGQ